MKIGSTKWLWVAALGLAAVGSAQAQESSPWSVQIGIARIDFHENVKLSAGGAPVPGAGARIGDNTTLAAEISYKLTPSLSAGLTIGVPVRTAVTGTGTAAVFGELGAVRYGPMGLTARWTFDTGSRWHPYVGAGLTYFVVMSEHDAFIKDLKVDNKLGTIVQAGVQYDLTPQVGLFLDVKKLYVKTTATGTLPAMGGAPAVADARLDPLVTHIGLLYRF